MIHMIEFAYRTYKPVFVAVFMQANIIEGFTFMLLILFACKVFNA